MPIVQRTITQFSDAQSAAGFVTPAFYNIERTVYQIPYPEADYASLVPVITEGNPWSRGTMFFSGEMAGRAEWLSSKGYDMPYADVARSSFLQGYELAGIGYEWTLEEINVAAMEGRSLTNEKAVAARQVAEMFLHNLCLSGSAEKNMPGLINHPSVPVVSVPADGTAGSTFWANKTSDLIIRDFNSGLIGINTATRMIEWADTVLLPFETLYLLATTPRSADSDETILSYIERNNAYTQRFRRPLEIRGLIELSTAGTAGDGRAVFYRRDPSVVRFHLPMPHQFLPPFQKGSMTWEIGGLFRAGGTEVRLPLAMRYLDLIHNG